MSNTNEEITLEPLQVVYTTADVNAPLELYSGRMLFRHASGELSGQGRLLLEWLPSPALRFRLRTERELSRDLRLVFELPRMEEAQLELVDAGRAFEIFAPNAGQISESELEVSGIVNEEVILGKENGLTTLLFHLPNVPEIALSPDRFVPKSGGGAYSVDRVLLRSGPWLITLDPLVGSSALLRNLKSNRGYGITAVGKLERTDGKAFSLSKARSALEALGYLLSFAFERWCFPMMLICFDRRGNRACEVWSPFRASRFQPHMGWFDFHHPGSLADLFPGFMRHWQDEEWREALKDAIYWFIEIHAQPVRIDTAVVVGQITLEMLGWLTLVERNPVISDKGFEKLPASDKLKLLLSLSSIPTTPPDELKAVHRLAKAENWQGPDCVVTIRNSIVHRNRSKREQSGKKKITDDVLRESYTLVCWYVELVLLRQLGYHGTYSNRLKERWVGQTEPVPWTASAAASAAPK